MRILSFDTSAAHCAAALLEHDTITASRVEEMARGQAERLFPLLQDILDQARTTWSALDGIAVGVGPGNFTGIRISVSAARGLALALDRPAVGVSTLEAYAFGLPRPVTAVLDARRGRYYAQHFPDGSAELCGELPDGPLTGPAAPDPIAQPVPLAEAIARIGAIRLDHAIPPKPLYLRAADAAPAADRGPVILPGGAA